MNIQEAKEEIARTFRAYMTLDDTGCPRIPLEKQRPVLLIGPPGIGKTAIMRQIADELQIGLCAYSMTHHTRQSAIGLPVIREKEYDGKPYRATEYTMSEIVASIYDTMDQTSLTSGILFLDEINCVSETLTPVMLQLLQNKTFGTHPLPPGWMIVAAGNPPEYNKSVRELDMVTLDRVKRMDIEASLPIWQAYACRQMIHPAIRSYLTVCPHHFYVIENGDAGQLFVTARGWEDLSSILSVYEETGEPISESLILQYLQHDEIAHRFYLFYDLFRHFSTGGDTDIFAEPEMLSTGMRHADISESLAVASLLFSGIQKEAFAYSRKEGLHKRLRETIDEWMSHTNRAAEQSDAPSHGQGAPSAGQGAPSTGQEAPSTGQGAPSSAALASLSNILSNKADALAVKKQHHLLDLPAQLAEEELIRRLEDILQILTKLDTPTAAAREKACRDILDQQAKKESDEAAVLLDRISTAYQILACAPDDICLLYFTTDLTNDSCCSAFLALHPCAAYTARSRDMLISEEETRLKEALHEHREPEA